LRYSWRISLFNIQEEGHFAKDGNFIWKKGEKEVQDAWLDDIDWVKVKQKNQEEMRKQEEEDEKEEEAVASYDQMKSYKQIQELLKPGN
jgi:hypothetical protein